MKRSILALAATLLATSLIAQDAAVEERLNRLSGQVEDLLAANARLQKQADDLARALSDVRERLSSASANAVSHDDLRRLASSIQEVDRKREADKEVILKAVESLKAAPVTPKPPRTAVKEPATPATPQEFYEHEVKPNENLSLIIQAYREKGIKVTLDSILKANPGLNPNRLRVGQVIRIPPPKD